jgi:hypothetical protein
MPLWLIPILIVGAWLGVDLLIAATLYFTRTYTIQRKR